MSFQYLFCYGSGIGIVFYDQHEIDVNFNR